MKSRPLASAFPLRSLCGSSRAFNDLSFAAVAPRKGPQASLPPLLRRLRNLECHSTRADQLAPPEYIILLARFSPFDPKWRKTGKPLDYDSPSCWNSERACDRPWSGRPYRQTPGIARCPQSLFHHCSFTLSQHPARVWLWHLLAVAGDVICVAGCRIWRGLPMIQNGRAWVGPRSPDSPSKQECWRPER